MPGAESDSMKPVIVTTSHRGVFFGMAESADPSITECTLHDSIMVIYWGTTKGVAQLAVEGPTSKSRLSAVVPRWHLRDVVSIMECTPEAAVKWSKI